MALPDSTNKAPNVFIDVEDRTGFLSEVMEAIRNGPEVINPSPSPPPPPPPITDINFIVDNAPGFIGELEIIDFLVDFGSGFIGDAFMDVRMGIGLEFGNPVVTDIPVFVNNAPSFVNPNITNIPFIVSNTPGFVNPNITNIPFIVSNTPGFANPNITIIPFVMANH